MNTPLLTAAILLWACTSAMADSATPPAGAIQFCVRNESFCERHKPAIAPLSSFPLLEKRNRQVNDSILPAPLVTDEQKRQENMNWRVIMPQGLGDCVEAALTKEQILAWDGIAPGAMHIAQVRLPGGDLHAVLLVNIGKVVVVLDNLTPAIWPIDSVQFTVLSVQDGWSWRKQ